MKCVKCGTENLNGEYCKVCGTRLNENVNYNRPAVSKRSRGLALLFAWIGWGQCRHT